MENRYPFEWLDLLITVTLNPPKTNITAISGEQVHAVIEKIFEEREKFQLLLKNQFFAMTKESSIELLIKKYHSTLIILLDQACENKKKITTKIVRIKDAYDKIITCLDEMLSFIEVRFSSYLGLNERVPATYLQVAKKELSLRVTKLKSRLYTKANDRRLVDIVFQMLYSFINEAKDEYHVTFKEVFYKKELITELEILENGDGKTSIYNNLTELLIYLNFNQKAFTNHFTQRVAEKINEYENITDKLDQLLVHFKEFNQMHRKPGIILNPEFRDLKSVVSNWFVQEIFYLEKKMHLSVTPLQGKVENVKSNSSASKEIQKVLCILSSDQTGLILRAADELRILIAKSMNEVFKKIVPHLSTPYKEDLSYDGMRSKSYVAEDRDKQIAIETLEKIIKKIKDY